MSTFVNAIVYGVSFYGIGLLFGFAIDIWSSILLGAVLSLVEPAVSIEGIKKKGASKSLISIIEGESLFNHGIAVAIIAFVKGVICSGVGGNALFIVFEEVVLTVVVGLAISFIMFKVLRLSNEPVVHILVSLFDVALICMICEYFGFSGVVASAVSGMYFSSQIKKIARWREVVDSTYLYEDFWKVVSFVLNGLMYVLVGVMTISVEFSLKMFLFTLVMIAVNYLSRYVSVWIGTSMVGKKNVPSKYSRCGFVNILSVTALRGGVSLALLMTMEGVLMDSVYEVLISTVFMTIVFTTIVQGLLVGKLYGLIEQLQFSDI